MEILFIIILFIAKKILGSLLSFILNSMGGLIQTIFNSIKEEFHQVLGYEVATVLGNIFIGTILGGVSLALIPLHITPNIQIRLVNLIVTPLVVGALVNLSSNIKFNKKLLGFDLVNFISGYTFALAMAGVRFVFAK